MATTERGKGVQRVLAKLRSSIDQGNYYEAHQMYRTLYFRYSAQQQYPELLDMLYEGALLLLRNNQQTSGADLASLLIDVLDKSSTDPTDAILENIAKLYGLISDKSPERTQFLAKALKWSMRGPIEYRGGHPKLHKLIAMTLWKEKDYSQSWYHFLRSVDGEGCASMLIEYQKAQGYLGEVDLFIAQAVLQYLCLQNKATAMVVFLSYTQQHPNIMEGPPFFLPLLNFIWFLLLTVDSGKLATFTVLCEQYQPSIKRDPSYTEYLDKIGQLFFGLPPPRPRQQNVIGNLLQTFLDGFNDDDEEDERFHPSSSQGIKSSVSLRTEDVD